MEKYLPVYTGV